MKKSFTIVVLTTMIATNLGAEVLYNKESAIKTKEVYTLSQLLPEQTIVPIEINGDAYGVKNKFLSFLRSDENDANWIGKVSYSVKINHCVTQDMLKTVTDKGFKINSSFADGYISGMRESINFFKSNGAKYVYVHEKSDTLPKVKKGKEFAVFFKDRLKNANNLFLDYELSGRCSDGGDTSLKDWLWIGGQVAALAVGIKGAATANTSLTSLATHTSVATNNTNSLMKDSSSSGGVKFGSFATKVNFSLSAVSTPTYFEDHPVEDVGYAKYSYEGYLFPIEEVEAHLAQYIDIPYNANIKNH